MCSLEIGPFWATVAAQHGLRCWLQIEIWSKIEEVETYCIIEHPTSNTNCEQTQVYDFKLVHGEDFLQYDSFSFKLVMKVKKWINVNQIQTYSIFHHVTFTSIVGMFTLHVSSQSAENILFIQRNLPTNDTR